MKLHPDPWFYNLQNAGKNKYMAKEYLEACKRQYEQTHYVPPTINHKAGYVIEHTSIDCGLVYEPESEFEVLAGMLPGANLQVRHPVTYFPENLHDVIMELNDDYKWTREQIADWLESLDLDLKF